MTGSDVHDMSYYKKCMMGGILSCGITHTIVCPLDIVKCRMQVSLTRHKSCASATWWRHAHPRWVCFIKLDFYVLNFCVLQANPGLYSSVGDGFRQIKAAEGLKGFTLVSIYLQTSSLHICCVFNNLQFYRVGPQLWSDTLLKVSESSVSMRSSRMSTEALPKRTPPSTRLLDSPSPQLALKLLPIVSYAHGKQ